LLGQGLGRAQLLWGTEAVEERQPCYPSCVQRDGHLLGQGLGWATMLSKLCMEGRALAGAGTGKSMVTLGQSGCRRAATVLSKLCMVGWALAGAGTGKSRVALGHSGCRRAATVLSKGHSGCRRAATMLSKLFTEGRALAVEERQPCYPRWLYVPLGIAFTHFVVSLMVVVDCYPQQYPS
jgi:hypothetical protein